MTCLQSLYELTNKNPQTLMTTQKPKLKSFLKLKMDFQQQQL